MGRGSESEVRSGKTAFRKGDVLFGKLIATIGDKTDPAKVKELATLNKEPSDRILELDKALMETNPKAKAKDLRLSAERLKGLAAREPESSRVG